MSVYSEPIDWLRQSIDSILKQTEPDFQFIIICDNPDNIEIINLLNSYQEIDKRIEIIVNKKNIGLTKSLNLGLRYCKGEYIARMDADDVAITERFSKQKEYLDNNAEIDAVFGYVYEFSSENMRDARLRRLPLNNKGLFASLFYVNGLVHPVVMLRKKTLIEKKITYDETMRRSQDYDLWLTMAVNGCEFRTIEAPLLYYRVSENQISHKNKNEQSKDALNIRIKCINNYFETYGNTDKILRPSALKGMYRNIIEVRNWNLADTQLFLMIYYTMPDSLMKYIDIFIFGIRKYKFSFKQMAYLLRKPLYKNPSLDLSDLIIKNR